VTLHERWHGGTGTYYPWRRLMVWTRWKRRQDAIADASGAEPGKLLLFLSHRWESVSHPDPTGRQILALKVGLALSLAAALRIEPNAQTGWGLPELFHRFLARVEPEAMADPDLNAWADRVAEQAKNCKTEEEMWSRLQQLGAGRASELVEAIQDRVLIWHDYSSMYQQPRSAEEERDFNDELERMNEIQAGAATTVLASNAEYASRAWCFLEVCGGTRNSLVELTPSWSGSMAVRSGLNHWAHISDQLIASLNGNGLESIEATDLRATQPRDLGVIARLISCLPLFGLVESDGSDLVGGSIPMAFGSGRWIVQETSGSPVVTEKKVAVCEDFGEFPCPSEVRRALHDAAGAEQLAGPCGAWIYTSQRLLSLCWASRASELWSNVSAVIPLPPLSSVACTWADSRSLGDDGTAWTRYIPSTVDALLIITQADLPAICRIYESVLGAHLAAGATVITYCPETGDVRITQPSSTKASLPGRLASAIVVPRVRRTTATAEYLLLRPDLAADQVNAMTALRLDPKDEGLAKLQLSPDVLDQMSRCRTRAEALSRIVASCWEGLAYECFTSDQWNDPAGALKQLTVIEHLVNLVRPMSGNPLQRRVKLYEILYRPTLDKEMFHIKLPERSRRSIIAPKSNNE
jgi:hypothetical protein